MLRDAVPWLICLGDEPLVKLVGFVTGPPCLGDLSFWVLWATKLE